MPIWRVVADDANLDWSARAADFLQSFCPPDADLVWSDAYFRWKLGTGNPAGTGFLTIAESDGRVVGTTSITPKRLWLSGKEVLAGEIGDTYTAADFRRGGRPATLHLGTPQRDAYVNKSIFARLVTETCERAEATGLNPIYGTPNANSMPGYVDRLGFSKVAWTNRNYVRPMPIWLGRKLSPLPLTGVLNALDTAWTALGARRNIEIEDLAKPEMIDGIWESVRANLAFGIVQDQAWLRHRFFKHPLARYSVRLARRRGRPAAVMISRSYRSLEGRPTTAIADWLADDGEEACLAALARGVIEEARTERSESILLWAQPTSRIVARLGRYGFVPRGESPVIIFPRAAPDLTPEAIQRIHFALASSDNI